MLSKRRRLEFFLLAAVIAAFTLGVGAPAQAATDVKRCHMGSEMGGHGVAVDSGVHSAHHTESASKPESIPDMGEVLRTVTSAFSPAICPLNGKAVCPHSGQHGHSGKGCCLKKCGKTMPGQDGFMVFTNLNFLISEVRIAPALMVASPVISVILPTATRLDNPDPRPPRIS